MTTGSALLFGAQIVANLGFLVSVFLLARGLPPPGRGTAAFATVMVFVVARLASLGVTEAIPVFVARRPAERARLLSSVLLFVLCTASAGAVIVSGSLLWLDQPVGLGRLDVAVIAIGVLVQSVVDAGNAYLAGCGRFARRAEITMTLPWFYALSLATASVTVGLSASLAVFLWVVTQAVRALLLVSASSRGIGFGRPDLTALGESIRFGLRAWVGTLSGFLNARLDQILLGLISTNATLGLYAVAVNASEVLLYLPDTVGAALLPALATTTASDRRDRTVRVFRSILVATSAGVVAAALMGPPLIPIVFGSAFAASTQPFLWLLPGALGFVAIRVFSTALAAASRPGLSALGPFTALLVGIGLDLALIPSFGASGAAVAASGAFIAGGAVSAALFRQRTGFSWSALIPSPEDLVDIIRALRSLLRTLVEWSAKLRGASEDAPSHVGIARRTEPDQQVRTAARGLAKAAIVSSQVLAWHLRGRPAESGLRILYYHRVSGDRDELAVSPRRFGRQLELIAASELPVLDLYAWSAQPRSIVGNAVALTFDDGYRDFLDEAFPVLCQRGWPAVVFVVPEVVDGRARFAWYGARHPRVLGWAEMRDIERRTLVRFEPHTLTHPVLTGVDDDRVWREVAGSKAAVEDALGRTARIFCYPGGHYGPREIAMVERAGYAAAVGCEYGVNREPWDRLRLRRTIVDRYDTDWVFAARLLGGVDHAPVGRRGRGDLAVR